MTELSLYRFFINKFRVQIDTIYPFDSVKRYLDRIKDIWILKRIKNTEVEVRLHIECALFVTIKLKKNSVIVTGDNLCYSWIHRAILIEGAEF